MRSELERLAVRVVDATAEHIEEISAIYAAAVATSHATFDTEPPGVDHWAAVVADTDPERGHHLLVAIAAGGAVAGYAKSSAFMVKLAYNTTCETSIYIGESARGAGVGTALYGELLERLDRSPLRLAVAGLAQPNPASTALHLAFGFRPVGTFSEVGVKFGRPWDVTWYQRPLV